MQKNAGRYSNRQTGIKRKWLGIIAMAGLLISHNALAFAMDSDDSIQVSIQQVDQILGELRAASGTSYLQHSGNELRLIDTDERVPENAIAFQKIKDGLEILGNRVFVYVDSTGGIERVEEDSTIDLRVGNKISTITDDAAIRIAVESFAQLKTLGSTSRLVWFRRADVGILAWQIETELAPSDGLCSATHFLTTVDADTGKILSQSQRGGNLPEFDPISGKTVVPCRSPIVINNTAGTGQAQSFGAQFPAVCSPTNGGCIGTLIAPNVVLGARHCGDAPGQLVRFGHNRKNPDFITTVQSVSLPGGGNPGTDITNGGDVAIITLNANVPNSVATPMRLIMETSSLVGDTATFAGYGGQGVGTQGQGNANGFRWAGENVIDRFGVPVFFSGANIFSADFDDGSAFNNAIPGSDFAPLPLEAMVAQGDSGGALFVEVDNEFVIIGVASFVAGSGNISSFGWTGYWTGSALYRDEIEAVGGQFADAEPPANDNFSDRIVINSLPATINANNDNGSTEAGESDLGETGATVWWSFDAPGTGIVRVDLEGSSFDTQLHIYTEAQNGLANLRPVAFNADEVSSPQSDVFFAVNAGESYEIRVGGFPVIGGLPDQGDIVMNVTFLPEGPVEFFWSERDLETGAINTSNPVGEFAAGSSGRLFLYYDPTLTDIDTGAFLDIATSESGIIEFTRAEALEFDIAFMGVPVDVRWGDASGETGTVSDNMIGSLAALNVISGTGMLVENTGPDFIDQGYDFSAMAFQFAEIEFNVVGPVGSSVNVNTVRASGNIANDGIPLDPIFGVYQINVVDTVILLGDVNCDGIVNLLDVQPFVEVLTSGQFDPKADLDGNGVVNLLDVQPFVQLLSGG